MARRDLPRNFHSHEYGGVTAPWHWFLLPAYTVLPFIRHPLGLQIVHPRVTVVRVVGLVFLPLVFEALYVAFGKGQLSERIGHFWLVCFALVYLGITLALFVRRWFGQRRGEELHSGEAGYSWLVWHSSLPAAICEQLIVPLAVWVLGYLVAHNFSIELGWWLMLAGISLCVMARWEYRRIWSQHQATVDDVVRAKTYEERMSRHETQRGAPSPASPDEPVFADLGGDGAPPARRRGR